MKTINRRDFLKLSVAAGSAIFAGSRKTVQLNVGYLPITDHLVLPVSHARSQQGEYPGFQVNPYLCRSWDEILSKVDMGLLDAAFMPAPLAMYKMTLGSSLRCVMPAHLNGSVIATGKSIENPEGLVGKTIGIPHTRSTHRVLLYKYLKDREIENFEDTALLEVAPPLTVKTLKSGKIDAYTVAEPWGIKGVNDGAARILELSKNIIPDHVCCLVMIKKRIIRRRTDIVSTWVKSLKNAGEYIHKNPEEAASIQKFYMNHNPGEIYQLVRDGMISYRHLEPGKKKLRIMHDLALECGVLPEACNLDEFVYSDF